MGKMVRAVLFTVVAFFSTAVFAENEDPCASLPGSLTPAADGYYEIGTADALYKFACMVNNGAADINAKLTADICLNACGEGESVLKADGTLNGDGSNFTQWTPIGTNSTPYEGTFDGDGHIVSGLYFNDDTKDYVGLFGYIGGNAKVQNVGVEDSYIKGGSSVGGVVGYNGGIVSNVYNTGAVSGTKSRVGGVVGESNDGSVKNVYNTGAVSGDDFVGGVVGYNVGFVSNVYNTGTVTGAEFPIGGVVGYYRSGIVSNGYYNTDFYTGNAVGGDGVGIENVKGKTTIELATLAIGSECKAFPMPEGECPWESGNISYDKVTGKLIARFPHLKNLKNLQQGTPVFEFEVVENVIQIADADDLKNFARLVNEFGVMDVDAELTADIVVNEDVLNDDGTLNVADTSKFVKWTPIGTSSTAYKGTFDGQGHIVSGLYIDNDQMVKVGFFGVVGSEGETKGVVKNVGVVDSYIKGKFFVGGVVGENAGIASSVFNTGVVIGLGNVGGVVGYNSAGAVSNVYNTGTVSGSTYVGGVVGFNEGGSVSNVYSTGMVTGAEVSIGGVVGKNGGTVSYSYYNKEFYTGNAVGENDGGTVQNVEAKKTDELASTTLPAGFSGEIWVAGSGEPVVSNGKLVCKLPKLKNVGSQPEVEYPEFRPNADGYYEISTAQELLWFAGLVNSGNTTLNGKLTADIVVNENLLGTDNANVKNDGTFDVEAYKSAHANAEPKVWTPIGTLSTWYTGTFDGNGKTISGLYFNDRHVDCVGLFGVINRAVVQNVGVVDSYIKGFDHVGGVVGYIFSVGTVSNVYNTGVVSGENRVGGVVGYNDGTVSNVYNTGAVSGSLEVGGVVGYNDGTVSNVYNTGAVSGDIEVGGVVGENNGTVSNVYNTGSVSGDFEVGGVVGQNYGTVNNVYSTGAVSGKDNVGGVVGYNEGTVSNVYNTGTVSGDGSVGGVIGYEEGFVEKAYFNTDFFEGDALGYGREEPDIKGMNSAELATLDVATAFYESDGVWNAGYSATSNGWWKYAFPSLKGVGTAPTFTVPDSNATEVEISNADELFRFAELVNAGNTTLNGKLTADIVVNEGVLKADGTLNGDGSNFTQWTPIGTAEKPYTGTFDGMDAEGNAHVISGLYFNDETADSVGLFGSTGKNAKVQNVGVEDSYFRGGDYVGVVVGFVREGGEISKVYSRSIVSGKNFVGGVIGYNDASIVSNVYNAGSVSGKERVGGVVGGVDNKGSVSNVYNMGSVGGTKFVIGGVVGFDNSAIISNAYFNTDFFTGNALGSGEDIENVEGKNSVELAAGATLKLDTAVWVVGAVSENVKRDTLYYPYLKVFGPHKYELSDVKKYAITVAVNDKAMGSVTGAGEYEYGTEVELSATAKKGFKFVKWSDGVKDAKRTIMVTKAEKITATFEKDSKKDVIIARAALPQFSVTASGKMVSIAGARPNTSVVVYDLQGNMVKMVVATAANFTFALPSAGVYIVKNGYTAKRVNVR